MDRLTTLKLELELIKNLRCLSYDLLDKCIEWYEHEIECIEKYNSENREYDMPEYMKSFKELIDSFSIDMAIEALSEPTKTEPTTITENMTNGDVLTMIFPDITERARDNEYYLDKDGDNLTYIHIDGDWLNKPYKGNFIMPKTDTDLISRKAVLDIFYNTDGLEYFENSNIFAKAYADKIKSLPSVNPTRPRVIDDTLSRKIYDHAETKDIYSLDGTVSTMLVIGVDTVMDIIADYLKGGDSDA